MAKKIAADNSLLDFPPDEGSLDIASYTSGSDLEEDAADVADTRIVSLLEYEEQPIVAAKNTIGELTVKPKDKYRFIRSVGFGGMKAVLQVRDKDTSRNVAMAIIPDYLERPESDINRFIREARITAQLEHPNIVPIHDIGADASGSPYFTMKFLRGKSLALIIKKLREGDADTLEHYDLPLLLRIFVRICNAVAFAHSKQIIHLDLKPENVHIGDFGEVLVLDWGLAKFIGEPSEPEADNSSRHDSNVSPADSHEPLTLDGVAKGTPGYMAPEQAAGQNQAKDQRTDIYGLGCILYAILTFESPLSGKDVERVLVDTIHGNFQTPREIRNPHRYIPAALEAICLKAMERDREDRYQSVSEMRKDLFSFMAGHATSAENAGSIKKTFLFINRNWLATLFVVTFLLLVAIVASLVFCYVNQIITVNL